MNAIELTPDAPVDTVVERGLRAVRSGFDTVLVSAHYNNRDPFAVLARLAARTDRGRLGPGIVNPFETHPVTLASRVATVAEQSDGRAVFGLGAGDPSTLANLGLEDDRGLEPVLETLTVARRLWDGERVDHQGSFEAHQAGLNFTVDSRIPIYVGGEGPDMCRMAAAHADGLLFNGATPADLEWARARVSEERSDASQGFDLAAYTSVSIAEDHEAARLAARRPVAFIAAGAPLAVLQRHGLSPSRASTIADHIETGRFDEADAAVSPDMLDAFAVAGDTQTVTRRFRDLLEYADSIVVGAPIGPDPGRATELAAEALTAAQS